MSHADMFGAPDEAGESRIGQLLKLAGRRPMPDPVQMSLARAAAREEWTRIVEGRGWRASLWKLSAAAIVAVVFGAAIWFGPRQPAAPIPGIEIATIRTVTGTVFVTSAGQERRAVSRSGVRLRAGDRIETSERGRAAFSIDGEMSVRFDWATSAVLDGAERLTLERGAVYVDAGIVPNDLDLRVNTPFGIVRHVGTQFEVRLHHDALGVRVREGTVAVERGARRWTSRAGERLLLARDGAPEREPIATFGADWAWVDGLAQPFRLEGATVSRFLDWASRELGLRWEYEDPAMAARVQRIVLHGSVDGLTPEEALAAVLPTCGLSFRRDGSRIVVTAARTEMK